MSEHKVHLCLSGNTLAEALATIGMSSGVMSASTLAAFSDEQLLAELRERMAAKNLVVRIVPFTEANTTKSGTTADNGGIAATETATETGGRKPGRPRNATKQVSDEAKAIAAEQAAAAAAAAAAREAPKTIAQEVSDDWGDETDEDPTLAAVTWDDVVEHLNAYNLDKGVVSARQLMNEVAGSTKLKEIDPAKYSAVVARITKELGPNLPKLIEQIRKQKAAKAA